MRQLGPLLSEARQALTSHSDTPGLDVQLLMAETVGRDRAWVLSHPEAEIAGEQVEAFTQGVQRLAEGEALPYVLGWWEFYGRRFSVTPAVLIPRPETESLVEAALDFLQTRRTARSLVDVGTGSGCIAVTLASELPGMHVLATDTSLPALRQARQNAERHEVRERVRFVQADLLEGIAARFDLLCANLPYIPSAELARLPVARREPIRALDGGEDGLAVVTRLLHQVPGALKRGGRALLEIDSRQVEEALGLARRAVPGAAITVLPDLSERDRVLALDMPA